MPLPRNLGPRAKRSATAGGSAEVRCAAEIAPGVEPAAIEAALRALQARILGWDRVGHLMTLEAPASRLGAIARTRGVVYLEAAESYSR